MKYIDVKELKEIVQSGHMNLLVGSGCSRDYLSTLSDIEVRMNAPETAEQAQKDYCELILKSKAVLSPSRERSATENGRLTKTRENYNAFLGLLAEIITKRSLHIVNKQVNIFTTNFDVFMEETCERLGIPYNDGFSGQIHRVFRTANFNRIQKYKSLQFDNTSDVPIFNIIKLHGSTSWRVRGEEIVYSDGAHIDDDLAEKDREDFLDGYKKQIAVINPNAEKHFETVLDTTYASLLRKFTLELEKENSVLIVIGFSLTDAHIRHLLYGVMQSNPTLVVIYYSHSPYNEMSDKLDEKKHQNLYVISPEPSFTLDKITGHLRKACLGDTDPAYGIEE
ncbi:MAG: SIR2 family protein [Patescibacteria group bacterium]